MKAIFRTQISDHFNDLKISRNFHEVTSLVDISLYPAGSSLSESVEIKPCYKNIVSFGAK